MNTYALLRQLFKYNNMQGRYWMGALTITKYLLCDNHVQISHHIKPNALAFATFSVSFLSRCERLPAALYDDVVGAPMACGCFLAWLCFFLTGGFDIYSFTGTNPILFSPTPSACSSPFFVIELSLSIIRLISVDTLSNPEIESDANPANTCIADISAALRSSFVKVRLAGRDPPINGMVLACGFSVEFRCCIQNVSTTGDCNASRGMSRHMR